MTLAPVTDWIKNINDHAINGSLPRNSVQVSSHGITLSPAPLVLSLAAGLRGDLRYPSSPSINTFSSRSSRDLDIVQLVEIVALSPPPRPASTALAKRHTLARMRLEVMGDRKLRIGRFLMETATAAARSAVKAGAMSPRGGQGVAVNEISRLLNLVTAVFRRREQPDDGSNAPLSGSPRQASPPLPPPPPFEIRRDIVAFMRPIYSLLGEALLGEPGPVSRLGCPCLAAATALCTAGLDVLVSSASMEEHGSGARAVAEDATGRSVVICYAEATVLMVSTKLETFLTGGGMHDNGDDGISPSSDRETTIWNLSSREAELEHLLKVLGAWNIHGTVAGWPYSILPPSPSQFPVMAGAQPKGVESSGVSDTQLVALVEEAEAMTKALQSGASKDDMWWRRVEWRIVSKLASCKKLLAMRKAR